MLGFLLITWKNGRRLKPYGLNSLDKYNMKITFLCIVIVVSCSVCASGDLEIYPGLKLDLPRRDLIRRRYIEPNEEDPYNYKQWSWNRPSEDDYTEKNYAREMAEKLERLEEFLESNDGSSTNLKTDDELPNYNNPRNRYMDDNYYREEIYRNMEKSNDRYNNFHYPNNAQMLDDVRPYPHEDDFTFGDEEEEEEQEEENGDDRNDEIDGVEVAVPEKSQATYLPEDQRHHKPNKMERAKETTTSGSRSSSSSRKTLANAKFVEDPTLFAYPPTDPRFFQQSTTQDDENVRKYDKSIYLTHRSEDTRTEKNKLNNFQQYKNEQQQDNVKVVSVRPAIPSSDTATVYIIAIVAGISAAATVGLIAVGIGWYNLQKHVKNASDVEYPAYGVTGPNKDASPSGDRRLAQSAQMYHYQHQKQQIIAMESRAAAGDRHGSVSEADSEEENEEGDYTVYECPGLAPTGEMEVKNPLFQDDPTPAQTPPVVKPSANADEKK